MAINLPIWRIVRIGGVSVESMVSSLLRDEKFGIDEYSQTLMSQPGFTTQSNVEEVALVRATPWTLGFEFDSPTKAEFEAEARLQELGLVSAETGPRLRLQYTDQPEGEKLYMAMEPLSHPSWKVPCDIFKLSCDRGKLWLRDENAVEAHLTWPLDQIAVFRRLNI